MQYVSYVYNAILGHHFLSFWYFKLFFTFSYSGQSVSVWREKCQRKCLSLAQASQPFWQQQRLYSTTYFSLFLADSSNFLKSFTLHHLLYLVAKWRARVALAKWKRCKNYFHHLASPCFSLEIEKKEIRISIHCGVT